MPSDLDELSRSITVDEAAAIFQRLSEGTENTKYAFAAVRQNGRSLSTDLLDAALAAHALGLHPIPVTPGAKHPPLIKWTSYQTRQPTVQEITQWWNTWPRANVAILTGTSGGIDVIDFDVDKDGNLPTWPGTEHFLSTECVVQTPRGGRHYYFRHTPGIKNSTGKLAPGVDVRGEGGYVLIPPSIVDVKPYETAIGSLAETQGPFSEWILKALGRSAILTVDEAAAGEKPGSLSPYAEKVVEREVKKIKATPDGTRNNQLNKSAFDLGRYIGGGDMPRKDVEEKLTAAALEAGLDKKEISATIKSGIDKGLLKPRRLKRRRRKHSLIETAELGPLVIECNDTTNADLFAAMYRQDVRYDWTRGKWLIWNIHRWRGDSGDGTIELAKETNRERYRLAWELEGIKSEDRTAIAAFAMKSRARPKLDAMIYLARSVPPLADHGENWDMDPYLLGVPNGVVDLRTGKLRDGERADRITKSTAAPYGINTECPRWLAFLDRIMAGNSVLIEYLHRLLGMCLTGDISKQIFPIFWGKGANGKSTFLDTIKALMGDYASDAPPSLLIVQRFQEHPTELADLMGKRFVVAGETQEGARLKAQLVKRMTGDATLKGRFMRQDYFQFPRTHKTILHTNHRPVIKDPSYAMWRRLRLIPFTVVIPQAEQDPELYKKLKVEWPGILAWLVRGCVAWQKEGLNTPPEVLAATKAYEIDQDVLADFLMERCMLEKRAFVSRKQLHAAYSKWAVNTHEKYPLGKAAFYELIGNLDGVEDDQRRIGGKPTRGFTGLELR